MTRQLVTRPGIFPISAPNVVTTRQLVLSPISVPICSATIASTFVTIPSLFVLDPIFCPQHSVVQTFLTICPLNIVTVRSLVLNPILVPIAPCVVPTSVPVILFTLLSLIIILTPPNTEMPPPCVGLDCS